MQQLARRGFTIIELSLSIAFIAVLSIIVVVLINNAVSAYHKGLTMNQVNTTGMDLVDDMRVAIQSSPATSLVAECSNVYQKSEVVDNCAGDKGMSFVILKGGSKVQVGSGASQNTPIYGVFCTGAYSYLWNSGYLFNGDGDFKVAAGTDKLSLAYKIKGGGSDTKENFKLLKVEDDERAVCKAAAGAYLPTPVYQKPNSDGYFAFSTKKIDITSEPIDREPVDLLAGNNSLAIFDLTTAKPAENGLSNSMFYAVSFILATVQGGININTSGNFCAAPEDFDKSDVESFDYCAINKFNFAATAAGEKT